MRCWEHFAKQRGEVRSAAHAGVRRGTLVFAAAAAAAAATATAAAAATAAATAAAAAVQEPSAQPTAVRAAPKLACMRRVAAPVTQGCSLCPLLAYLGLQPPPPRVAGELDHRACARYAARAASPRPSWPEVTRRPDRRRQHACVHRVRGATPRVRHPFRRVAIHGVTAYSSTSHRVAGGGGSEQKCYLGAARRTEV